ncbi:MAG: hypothetical protein ACFFCQ_12325 [Promethearchaeota archaeon]
MSSLSIRTERRILEELDHLAKMNQTDRATEARKILLTGIKKAKLELAIRLYQEGTSLGQAAEQARVLLWDLIEYFPKVGQTTIINLEELKQEFKKALDI